MSSQSCFAVALLLLLRCSKAPIRARCPLLPPFQANPSSAERETHPADAPQAPEPCGDAAASSPESHAALARVPSETAVPRTSQNPVRTRSSETLRFRSSFCTAPAFVASCHAGGFSSYACHNSSVIAQLAIPPRGKSSALSCQRPLTDSSECTVTCEISRRRYFRRSAARRSRRHSLQNSPLRAGIS